jgi:eukaryotic-like serine/threonine-protein kinase
MSLDEPERPTPPTGASFGRYRLLERIGAGGMAEIYKAVVVGDQGFTRTVAIKRIREEVAQVADIGRLFADEARLSALLDHPNIVQVIDFGQVAGSHYLAMEHLKGKNLDEVMFVLRRRNERLEPALALFIAREVARGLGYAHAVCDERGRPLTIVHRDVSPANIMLVHAGAVKLLDFGIARITSELRQAVTQGRGLRGKCPYLAPEQITGGAVDGRSDIFALGVVLWEMLTGQRLFDGDTDLATIESVLNRDIPPPSAVTGDLPGALDGIVMAALARDPDRRYRSAEDLAADLDEVMRALPGRHDDITALLERLFGRVTLELPVLGSTVATVPERPGARFALELPAPRGAAVEAASVDRNAVTRPVEPTVLVAADVSSAVAGAAEVSFAVAARPPAVATPPAPVRAPRRRGMALIIGGLLVAELAAVALYRGLGGEGDRAAAAATVSWPVTAGPCTTPLPPAAPPPAPVCPTPAAAAQPATTPAGRRLAPRRSLRKRQEARSRALRHARQAALTSKYIDKGPLAGRR